jgi:hypothetical protein
MKEYYIVYAHGRGFYDGCLYKKMIGIANNQTEIDTIISNYRKERQVRDYRIDYFLDENKNIICSAEKFENQYLR